MNDERNWGENRNDSGQQPPRYEHYQFHEESRPALNTSGPSEHKKNRNSFQKKAETTVALAVIFGLVAAVVFQAANFTADRFLNTGSSTAQIGTTQSVNLQEAVSDSGSTDEQTIADTASENGTVAAVAQASMPSVVAITTVSVQEIPSFFGYGSRQYKSAASGSGIIVGDNDDELLIATNNHVVEGATTLSVCFIGDDVTNAETETVNAGDNGDLNVEDAVSAKIKGTDADNDLAVVAVKKADIPEDTLSQIKIAQIGSSDDLVVGQQVVAIGNALGYGQSVTSGWVSALNRTISTDDGDSTGLIQTDAAINPGNSGGALLNMKGELIGINSAKYADSSVEGMGYAIPISKAKPILEDLMNRETREKVDSSEKGYLGVVLANLTTEAIQMYNMPTGAFVRGVEQNSPAQESGLCKGDIIVKFDGQKVSDGDDLMDKLQYYKSGEKIEAVIARANNGVYEESTIELTLGTRPDNE
ncbi:MAG: trypsin-like peptidase domain-containing protein [Blautia sp.]|uniref:S1C family serine protease n=1 Tax=unclassified Blautia TaxID=2648079 RepID=UPI0025C6E77F|nr:trypsin-like peptidase domain-containing protein [Blautia sp.]MCI6304074.1 trypsin-like peptidase domain-containing protein [Blautia sp.]MCI7449988.1 trypsin-like peptidase domain-containing protein [Blautia sp.]MDD6413241.1 trypsin-like peptidase domain-containing protein [Blautia sp.]MDY4115510.1 trypsin-like peptidase domain-containing protein [Blautia sp.]